MINVRLKIALLGIFSFVALVPLVFLAIWSKQSTYDNELNSVNDIHLLLAQNLTGALTRYAVDVEAIITDISNHLEDNLDTGHRHLLKTIGITMVATVGGLEETEQLRYGNVNYLPLQGVAAALNETDWKTVGKIQMSGVMPDQKGKPAIYLRYFGAPSGETVIASLSTDYIVTVQKAVTFGEKGHAAIIDHRGRLLAHPKGEWQAEMKDISKLTPAQKMMSGGTGVITFFSPAVKADMIAGYSVVPSTGWGVMIPQPISELEERAIEVQKVAFVIGGIGFLCSLLIGFWLSRLISKPILSIVTAASDLAENKKSVRVTPEEDTTIVELDKLCSSFNDMAKQVEDVRNNLEERVDERTKELQVEIQERFLLEKKLRQLATHDQLTGLANRSLFFDRLDKALKVNARTQRGVALFFIDLDGFKAINDKFGHGAGDQLLIKTADRLNTVFRKSDTVSRHGGDEFVVLLLEPGNSEELSRLGQKVLDRLQQPFNLSEGVASVSASIGIALAGKDMDTDKLIELADKAMYAAKAQGKNSYVISE
ncbi:PDC sensor domain-containing protein [Desulforhopalus sp. 52FAK]